MEEHPTKSKRTLRLILYVAVSIFFVVNFFFLSDHTLRTHRELNRKIENLNDKIIYTKNQVGNVYTFDQLSSDSVLLEKYAREQLNMHKNDEDVFILIYE